MYFLKQTFLAHHSNNYRPHLIRRHGLAFALMLVIGIQLVNNLNLGARPQVLGYATNITVPGLLSGTNAERAAASKTSLDLNSKLNSAAQGKANHMITNNYWAHTSPDGVTPWYWFDWAGYDYKGAGENLAYGFSTSDGVINGWMNSQGHRDNLLNSVYEDVGFGIANGANYQGGPNTVVVALYGDPVTSSAPPPAVTPAPAPSPPQPEVAAAEPEVAETPEPEATEAETPAKPLTTAEEESPPEQDQESSDLVEISAPTPKRISNLEALLEGQAGWALYSTSLLALLLGFVYAYRHVVFIHRTVIRGENFMHHHPLLEASIVYILIWLLLSGTFGNIL